MKKRNNSRIMQQKMERNVFHFSVALRSFHLHFHFLFLGLVLLVEFTSWATLVHCEWYKHELYNVFKSRRLKMMLPIQERALKTKCTMLLHISLLVISKP